MFCKRMNEQKKYLDRIIKMTMIINRKDGISRAPIEVGYKAYNGHVFSEADAKCYNISLEWDNLDTQHRTFCNITRVAA